MWTCIIILTKNYFQKLNYFFKLQFDFHFQKYLFYTLITINRKQFLSVNI